MNKWLSILIPSNRPDELERYIESLKDNASSFNEIELIILIDDNYLQYVEFHSDRTIIHYPTKKPVSVPELQYECYKLSTGKWIMLGNDDLIMETRNWDSKIRLATTEYPDEVALIYPNDGMFGKNLACFPVVSRKVLDRIQFFPQPYRRYKVDDTLFYSFPYPRKIYLENVVMRHLNDEGEEGKGYKLATGRIYPIDIEAASHDNQLWAAETFRRLEMANTIAEMMEYQNA